MTYLELVALVAERAGTEEAQARQALDAAFEAIVGEVAGGGKVVVGGFGTFKGGLKRRRPGADKSAPRATKLVLTPSSTLNDRLNP